MLELFAGIGLGVLRAALAGGYTIRKYTYVDKDTISRHIALAVLHRLHEQHPSQLPLSAFSRSDGGFPQNVAHCTSTFLANLVSKFGPMDLLGAS